MSPWLPVGKHGHCTVSGICESRPGKNISPAYDWVRLPKELEFQNGFLKYPKWKFQSDFVSAAFFQIQYGDLSSSSSSCSKLVVLKLGSVKPIQRLSQEVGSRQLAPDLTRKAFFWSVFAKGTSAEAFILGCELGSFPCFIGLQAIALYVLPGHHTYSNSFSNTNTQWGPNLSLQHTSFLGPPPLIVPLVFHHLHSVNAS